MTVSMLLPIFETSLVTLRVALSPSDTIAMTAPTPITMPRPVSSERMALRRISRSAMRMMLQITARPQRARCAA